MPPSLSGRTSKGKSDYRSAGSGPLSGAATYGASPDADERLCFAWITPCIAGATRVGLILKRLLAIVWSCVSPEEYASEAGRDPYGRRAPLIPFITVRLRQQ